MKGELIIGILGICLGLCIGINFGVAMQSDRMTDRCKTTGMYLTEGYAITCRVLTNEGYAPMIEQQKGK